MGTPGYTWFCGHMVGGPKGDTGLAAPSGAVAPQGFRAWKNNVDQTGMASGVPTKLTFPVEFYDYGGYYDAALSRWTPPAGIIHIDTTLLFTAGVTNATSVGVQLYKNGVVQQVAYAHNAIGSGGAIAASFEDVSNGTDYYELYGIATSATTATLGGASYTFISGHVTGGPKGDTGATGPTGPQGPPTVTLGSTITQHPLEVIAGSPDTLRVAPGWSLPVGMVVPFAGSVAPNGWLLCDGRTVSRTVYVTLFGILSTTYGAGDGTTFGIPDLRGRAVFGRDPSEATARLTNAISGVNSGTLGAAGGNQRMHDHTHTASTNASWPSAAVAAEAGAAYGVYPNAATVTVNSTAFGGTSQNMPPAIILNYIIFAGV